MSDDIVKELYLNGYSKDYIYHIMHEVEGRSRSDIRDEIKGYDNDPYALSLREAMKKEAMIRNKMDKGYIKTREAGFRYRLFQHDKDLEIIQAMYPDRF